MEGRWPTTGPAKNLIELGRRAAGQTNSALNAKVAMATFRRGKEPPSNDLARACE